MQTAFGKTMSPRATRIYEFINGNGATTSPARLSFKLLHDRWINVYKNNERIGSVVANLGAVHPEGTWKVFSRKIGIGWQGFSSQSFQNAFHACKHLLSL